MNKFDFKNRTAVITGGGQGFGLDIAKRFLDSGAKVIIWDIDEQLLKLAFSEVNNENLSYYVVLSKLIFTFFPKPDAELSATAFKKLPFSSNPTE